MSRRPAAEGQGAVDDARVGTRGLATRHRHPRQGRRVERQARHRGARHRGEEPARRAGAPGTEAQRHQGDRGDHRHAPLNDVIAGTQQATTIAERFKADGIKTVLLIGGTPSAFTNGLKNSDYRPKLVGTNFSTFQGTAINKATDPAFYKNAVTADIGTDFNDPSLQKCFKTVAKATGETMVENPETGNPSNRTSARNSPADTLRCSRSSRRGGQEPDHQELRKGRDEGGRGDGARLRDHHVQPEDAHLRPADVPLQLRTATRRWSMPRRCGCTPVSDDRRRGSGTAKVGVQAAGLAVAVLDAEAEREAAQAEAKEQVLFADDLLPGVGDEQLTLGARRCARGHLRPSSCSCCSRRSRSSRARRCRCSHPTSATHWASAMVSSCSSAGASGAFLVLGACRWGGWPIGYRRAPIIGWARAWSCGVCVCVCGLVATRSGCSGRASVSGSRSRTRSRCTGR